MVNEDDVDTDIQLALELIRSLEYDRIALPALVDRIELVTDDPETTRRIIERAKKDEVLNETDGEENELLLTTRRTTLDFEDDVISKEGDFSCQRCGKSLSTGYFIDYDSGEVGPFGSTCIKKVTGRK
ncbi:MAG: DUF5830 family protein [Halobacteria archaeon]|nr:DUF5830 family protein [Halobacteria archaeon]